MADLAIEKITANPHQPRQQWDEAGLRELAESIRASGLIQPVIVRQMGQSYQLIAGERRLRAAQIAGQATIAAIVRRATEEQLLEWALIENIHRSDLNPLERGRAYQNYVNNFCLSQDEAAQRLGEDRATIANYIRLLGLPPEIRDMIASGQISMGHARALLGIADDRDRIGVAKMVLAESMSVRQLERVIQRKRQRSKPAGGDGVGKSPHIAELEHEITGALGTRVSIRTTGRRQQRGTIVIEFYSLDDFERIREVLLGGADRAM